MQPLKIGVILGSTRRGRFGEKPALWILGELNKQKGVQAELIDLADYDLPFFDEPVSPGWITEPYRNEAVARFTKKIGEMDGFVVVAPEYNRSVGAAMKNAFDWVYREWSRKPIGFVGYGNLGGGRAIEHMRSIAVELQMAPVRSAVHLPVELYRAIMNEKTPVDPSHFDSVKQHTEHMIEQIQWWGHALKAAREADQPAKAAA